MNLRYPKIIISFVYKTTYIYIKIENGFFFFLHRLLVSKAGSFLRFHAKDPEFEKLLLVD